MRIAGPGMVIFQSICPARGLLVNLLVTYRIRIITCLRPVGVEPRCWSVLYLAGLLSFLFYFINTIDLCIGIVDVYSSQDVLNMYQAPAPLSVWRREEPHKHTAGMPCCATPPSRAAALPLHLAESGQHGSGHAPESTNCLQWTCG